MDANASRPDPGEPEPRSSALHIIRMKLERVLNSRRTDLAPFQPEIKSILDALAAANRETGGMTRRGRLGDNEMD